MPVKSSYRLFPAAWLLFTVKYNAPSGRRNWKRPQKSTINYNRENTWSSLLRGARCRCAVAGRLETLRLFIRKIINLNVHRWEKRVIIIIAKQPGMSTMDLQVQSGLKSFYREVAGPEAGGPTGHESIVSH
ncbi:hypothetical protein A6M21_06225 [Desulfotomaculum copahuensis]|uniref:Uncharacterized protein n=1 Tax=Desulfotomaculum copahuensis TaxID=1838280 RepID=A0A1B7LH80_9FIRM|nr:hypothetical protein A6M21_06225 [Desulfotomaculum copahuensis]